MFPLSKSLLGSVHRHRIDKYPHCLGSDVCVSQPEAAYCTTTAVNMSDNAVSGCGVVKATFLQQCAPRCGSTGELVASVCRWLMCWGGLRRKLRRAVSQNDCRYASKLPRVCPAQVRHADRINIAGAAYWARSPFLQPVKPRWPSICICKYMVRVRVRVSVSVTVTVRVTVRVCHDMFRTRLPMFDRLQK